MPVLTVDLRFDAVGESSPEPGRREVGLHLLASRARSPRALRELLRGERFERVEVERDGLPLNALQAGAQGLIGLARTRRFVVRGDGAERESGRTAFLARAVAEAARAVPAELLRTAALARVARRAAATDHRIARRPAREPASVLYLRVDPTVRFHGRFVGGAATHTAGVINGLVSNGLDVSVLAPEPLEGIGAVPVEVVPVPRVLHFVPGLTGTGYSLPVIERAALRRADFVYQRYALGAHAGLEVARRLGVPLVLEFNGSEIWVERHWRSRSMRLGETLAAVEARNLRDASLVVVVSEPLKRQVLEQGVPEERVLVNPNGTDVERLAPYRSGAPAEWRRRIGQPEAPTVGFIGTFGVWHGVGLLPDLVEQLARVVPDARWILVGDGDLRAEVESEIARRGHAERVLVTGVVEHDRALEMLAACDVCVSPHVPNPDGSEFFGSPTKIFEYMGLAKPIVASDLAQIGEVLEHESSGLLCPPGDVPAAVAATARLLGDPALRERLGEGALRRAQERYSWRAHTRRTLDALLGSAPS